MGDGWLGTRRRWFDISNTHGGEKPMSVYQALMLMIAFATLMLIVVSFR